MRKAKLQLMACDAKMAHFYVYGKKNQLLIEVPRDDNVIYKLVSKLESWYFSTLLPALMKKLDTP